MSEAFTAVSVDRVVAITLRGHIGYDDAIKLARAHWQAEYDRARRLLDGIDRGGAKVYHQRGIYRVTSRREIQPPRDPRVSDCPACGKPGRFGVEDWCHESTDDAIACPREGWYPGKDDANA